ncbi:hypothetical protein CI102_10147 [Trichoderma harzianum]|uniref:Secreted protein n=1 Tax=Trichoderma harzianum CBS 226.95 TaxID=983964 RepID=A0A2T4ADQ6_TRIHA|nr:hypothetical protein M431DRAFT_439335 [Trichoderma harzianum CBS 226.95]PKK44368.1 hypothetical protein CI102_10147 [Trichoderma harzianum]PTB55224.1 hypothetical protein M431DRAFT_439335 [Trichoderma harzianum CBS 226.95]
MSMDKGFRIGSGLLRCLTRALFIARASACQLRGLDSILPQVSLSSQGLCPQTCPAKKFGLWARIITSLQCGIKTCAEFPIIPNAYEAKSTSFGLRNDRVETPSSPGLVELRTRAPCWTDVRSGGGRWPPVTPRRRATNALR